MSPSRTLGADSYSPDEGSACEKDKISRIFFFMSFRVESVGQSYAIMILLFLTVAEQGEIF